MAPVTLGGYAAKRCARVTHNRFAPGTPPPAPAPPELVALREAGIAFEAGIFDELRSAYGDPEQLLILDPAAGMRERQRRTVEAMDAGVAVLAGGWLPNIGGRSGQPDVLIRVGAGYLPVDIKGHRTQAVSKRGQTEVSALSAPDQVLARPGYSNHGPSWRDDAMQLAHYTRMLHELGFHPGTHRGGIIGTSDLTEIIGEEHGITWYDLDTETITTYSDGDPSHRTKRTILEYYDHEFAFRLEVAQAAASGRELVRPYRIDACNTCDWFDYCMTTVRADDASFAIEAGHLNVREWQYLYQQCGDGAELSVAQLAEVDADTHVEAFRIQSVGTQKPQDRLAKAISRARMTAAGVDFEQRGPDRPMVPCADIEVDFDIEWDGDRRVYQWGLRIRDGQDDTTARYDPVVSFDPLDDVGEAALASEFSSRIRGLRGRAEREGKTLQVFHWHHPETSFTAKFADVVEALDGLTYDLRKWFDATYFARTGSSIKLVAGYFDFHWEVDEPGGLASQTVIESARGQGPDAETARQWCLRYNECDVAAQAAIRDGLRLKQ
ncbi:recombinase RecB [[Mycobacterium] crassicus]|uniref:Recombinase RecB n=1 Tax=[Mycobacterium] crassicus TaxID=2872309 RepID=A0ABU5XRJ3_9MYCO|nr:recombinase RecB [Mycolicibacter sp. MYC098]MEB3023696.1 recombinase RecB [Mycolicibacter sp. MYC098]